MPTHTGRDLNRTNVLLHGLDFVRALNLIANLLEEKIVFASLTPSAIAIAPCTTFPRFDAGTDGAMRRRHFLNTVDRLSFHLHREPPNDIPAIVVCAF